MDGIQSYNGPNRPLVAHVHTPPPPSPSAIKAPSDYVRAIRKRIWLVLTVAIPIATAGTLYVLRMPAVYLATAMIEIKPPTVDPLVAQLVSRGERQVGNGPVDDKYAPDTLNLLRTRTMLELVLRDAVLALPASAFDGDPVAELAPKITTRQNPMSHQYFVTLEGRDPDLITRTLNLLLIRFKEKADDKNKSASQNAHEQAAITMKDYEIELRKIESTLATHVKESSSLSPGGRNLNEAKYEALAQRLYSDQLRAKTLDVDIRLNALKPNAPVSVDGRKAGQVADLERERQMQSRRLAKARRASRDERDPSILLPLREIQDIDAQIAELQTPQARTESLNAEGADSILANVFGEIDATQGKMDAVLKEMKSDMPAHQRYVTLMSEYDLKARQLAEIKERLSSFDILTKSQEAPVKVIDEATEPTIPLKPNRPVYIAACIFLSMGLGLGLVCFLENIDHSVKVPEHLTAGLSLPLFGVVPRMRRTSRNHRGGHLWTPGAPDSIEADAYRNLRASLLGATQQKGPIVTLLVTSAKAGEGKSTTALNLAATCARAGERTLLMDVDLRRPSLNEVFPGHDQSVGLVDVLRGDLPWQRAVVQSDLPNLDFLPTGDPREVPIEILGSLELRQLLISLSEHHYDRVILDGPAVLGLADCRMLGRIVDAAVMVVRSGSQELRPLQRAKAMLEQSQVHIAGLVFNGLSEDLQNWSSYGPNPLAEPGIDFGGTRDHGPSRGLGAASPHAAAALMSAEPVEA